ncbi:MAG: hypothetical protein GKR90_15075 [Pseudomonadales bacterium]|nr:hypothetical protein [Pseudomonadales bacterium]
MKMVTPRNLSLVLVVGLALFMLAHTRIGVFIVFDVFGDLFEATDNLVTDAEQGPLRLDRSLQPLRRLLVPAEIEQISSLSIGSGELWLGTDQSELFSISAAGELLQKFDLLGGPLLFRQGSVEGLVRDGRSFLAGGELDTIGHWSLTENKLTRLDDVSASVASQELTGLCQNSRGVWGSLETAQIIEVSLGKTYDLDLSGYLKPDHDLDALLFSGLDCDDENFYLVTENYASLVVARPAAGAELGAIANFGVYGVFALDPIEASDVAVDEGLVYVSVDHNYFDPHPPLYIYELPIL